MLFILSSMLDLCILVPVFIMIYFIRNLILHLSVFSTLFADDLLFKIDEQSADHLQNVFSLYERCSG
jgi:hypothetical protein